MKQPKPKVKLLWTGDETVRARIVHCGDKVEFSKGSWHMADYDKANELAKHYKKFKVLEADQDVEEAIENEMPVDGEAPKARRKKVK